MTASMSILENSVPWSSHLALVDSGHRLGCVHGLDLLGVEVGDSNSPGEPVLHSTLHAFPQSVVRCHTIGILGWCARTGSTRVVNERQVNVPVRVERFTRKKNSESRGKANHHFRNVFDEIHAGGTLLLSSIVQIGGWVALLWMIEEAGNTEASTYQRALYHSLYQQCTRHSSQPHTAVYTHCEWSHLSTKGSSR